MCVLIFLINNVVKNKFTKKLCVSISRNIRTEMYAGRVGKSS